MSTHSNPTGNTDKQIDATLRLFAHAQPPPNLEQRIHARLYRKPAQAHKNFTDRFGSFLVAQRIVFASVAAALACCAIVIGSVQHSRQSAFPAIGIHVPAPASGLGAASGARIAPTGSGTGAHPLSLGAKGHRRPRHGLPGQSQTEGCGRA